MLLDEPTAALAPRERTSLLRLLRRLRDRGVAIAFVTHNLDEVLELSDQVSVFRDGTLVASAATADWDKRGLISAMLGHEVEQRLRRRESRAVGSDPMLRVRGLAVPGLLYPTDLELRAGEVLGVAGLVGSGRSSLLRALAGAERTAAGTLLIGGVAHPAPRSPRRAQALGIAFVPEDRKAQGLVPEQSAASNVVLSDLRAVSRLGLASRARTRRRAAWAATPYGFDAERLAASARALSGGNQQKLLLARTRHRQPRILLADEPTRGIDVGAKAEILAALRAAAIDDELSVVIVSSDLEELEAIADRVLVMREGAVVDELDTRAGEVVVGRMLRSAFGVETAPQPIDRA